MSTTSARHAPTVRTAGSPRWGLMTRHRVWVDGKLLLKRRRIVQTPWFAVLLTRICAPDPGRDPHSHSRPVATLILSGWYAERAWAAPELITLGTPGVVRHHRRWSVMAMRRHWAHRITEVSEEPLRTLVLAGPHRRDWYFWTPDGPADWRDYG
jgi:hypothetical protein